VRTQDHMSGAIVSQERFEENKRRFHEDEKRFFKLFEDSTLEGSLGPRR
jgi:hypothetical protein